MELCSLYYMRVNIAYKTEALSTCALIIDDDGLQNARLIIILHLYSELCVPYISRGSIVFVKPADQM